jgi:hypothetical protein
VQRLEWYVRRLRGMSAGEIAWRLRSHLRDTVDRARVGLGRVPRPHDLDRALSAAPGFPVTDLSPGGWRDARGEERSWCDALVAQADRAAAHRLSFFDLEDRHLGDPIDWNRDHSAGKAAPMGFAAGIDYRDFAETGDCKLVWEPSRHQHLVVLGRAYRATGDARYAQAVAGQLRSWLDQCPFGQGMQWRSPLELAIRLINWVWALGLVEGAGVIEGPLRERVLHAAWLHMWDVVRKFSQGSSANNHVIGEAAGVFIGASYFTGFADAAGWRRRSAAVLERECLAQTHADGGNKEQAFAYHLFVLEFLLLAWQVGRATGQPFSAAYGSAVERMLEFAGAMGEAGDEPPAYGDADDGYVLDLGEPRRPEPLLATGALLTGRGDLKRWSGGFRQSTRWLLGQDARTRFEALPVEAPAALASRAFPDTGYYLLQSGTPSGADRIGVLFDCGELGFGSIAAHGHADALSVTLRAFGTDVLVDPGTYDYFTHAEWRRYFRSTAAHNTVEIDERDQSQMLGLFLWGDRAHARCVRFQPDAAGGEVTGEHDGYERGLEDPVSHRRTVRLEGAARAVTVVDEIHTDGYHRAAVRFHLAEHCRVAARDGNRIEIRVADRGVVILEMDSRLAVDTLEGSTAPIGGWVSRGYHRKVPATTLVGRAECAGDTVFVCRIEVLPPGVGAVAP